MKKNVGIRRETAIRLVNELVERVKVANKLPKEEVPHRITKLYVFGSYLSDKEKLGDIDIFYDQEEKWNDNDAMNDYFFHHIKNNSSELSWWDNPLRVTRKYIRNYKKSYSFHAMWEMKEMIKMDSNFKYKELLIN